MSDNRIFPTHMRSAVSGTARYRSNNGKGPMVARIIGVTNESVKMERWYEKNPRSRRVSFELPISFLDSPSCGWMLITN